LIGSTVAGKGKAIIVVQKGVPETESLPSAISGAGLLVFVIITVMLSSGTGSSTIWSAGKTGKKSQLEGEDNPSPIFFPDYVRKKYTPVNVGGYPGFLLVSHMVPGTGLPRQQSIFF
jgi:hypothetical protein